MMQTYREDGYPVLEEDFARLNPHVHDHSKKHEPSTTLFCRGVSWSAWVPQALPNRV
jgi:hypothetical protein